ncbi:WD40-repeat-containing domain protein [Suillus subluteus]|nr:WD40-repeat-containing domain protein [Suillus subluteus]
MSSSISNRPAIAVRQTMRGHTKQVSGAAYLPDGERIITCSADGSLQLRDLESGRKIGEDWRDGNEAVWSMALSPNGKIIASGSGGSGYNVRLWDVETMKVIAKWVGHTRIVCALCWSADSERVASGSWDGTVRVWDGRARVRDGRARVQDGTPRVQDGIARVQDGTPRVHWIPRVWDGTPSVRKGSPIFWDGRFWDIDGEDVDVEDVDGEDVDGEDVDGEDVDGEDVDGGDKTILTIETGHDWVNAVMYSPDSSKLVTGGDRENAVKIWDAKTGKLLNKLKHYSEVSSLAWTSDGKKHL